MITTYRSSDGRETLIAAMAYTHLVNALRKREREAGGGPDELVDALRAEVARRGDPDAPGQPLKPLAPASAPPAQDIRAHGGMPVARLQPAPIGDNQAPPDADPLIDRLNEQHQALLDKIADHELLAARLPKEVASDEDVAKVAGWVKVAKDLVREAEASRVTAKEPFLDAGRKVDGWAKAIKDAMDVRWRRIEQRSTAYLEAKRTRERAEAQARQAAAQQAAEEQRQREVEERRLAAVAAERARHAEEDLRREAAAVASPLAPGRGGGAVAEAEQRLRVATQDQQLSTAAADQAALDAKKLQKAADRTEQQIATGKLERVSAGGASATLATVWTPVVDDPEAVRASLGPLAPFLSRAAVEEALARAARADPRPTVPGVTFRSDTVAQTR